MGKMKGPIEAIILLKKQCDRCGTEYRHELPFDQAQMQAVMNTTSKPVLKITYEKEPEEIILSTLCPACAKVVENAIHRILNLKSEKGEK